MEYLLTVPGMLNNLNDYIAAERAPSERGKDEGFQRGYRCSGNQPVPEGREDRKTSIYEISVGGAEQAARS